MSEDVEPKTPRLITDLVEPVQTGPMIYLKGKIDPRCLQTLHSICQIPKKCVCFCHGLSTNLN